MGDYYLPVGTRFEIADQEAPEDCMHTEKTVAASPATAQTAPTTPAADPDSQTQDRPAIGRFGRTHAAYLKSTQRHVYSRLVVEGKLGAYLVQIDKQANAMLDLLIRQMAEREGITEQLKATDQMEWVWRMNSIHIRAKEIVNNDLIYN